MCLLSMSFFLYEMTHKTHILLLSCIKNTKGHTMHIITNSSTLIEYIGTLYTKLQNISSCRLTSNNYATLILLNMKSLHCYNTICVCLYGMYTGGNMFRSYPFPIIDREMKRITFLAIWKVVWSISSYHSIL